ncbi:MAG TPA: hypothetical protein VK866_00275 [Acidimicrobiales bacterium]|nr:hypothetical protein [Acidimicrobiales bacterium]
MRRSRWSKLLALLMAFGLIAAACGDDDDAADGDDTTEETAAGGDEGGDDGGDEGGDAAVALGDICPSPIIIQTDWNPQAEHGALYQMVGEGYEIDTDAKVVTGPLVAGGAETGVDIEIRIGGPAIGFQQVTAQMYQDQSIHLGYVSTDEAIQNFEDNPTKAIVAPLEINPQIIMWDPETFDAETIADLPDDTLINVFGPAVYLDYLVGNDIIVESQIDGSYDGTPARFITEGGSIAQQGFASAEPYLYENVFEDWGKPVSFQLIHDAGWEVYAAPLAGRPDVIDENAACWEAFVPVVQQSVVDYVADPTTTNELIIELVEAYDTGWVYETDLANWSIEQQLDLGLVGNGPDATLGNFDIDRIQKVIDDYIAAAGVGEGVTPDDLVTNEYIDESIGL